jgi:hypothetical protein
MKLSRKCDQVIPITIRQTGIRQPILQFRDRGINGFPRIFAYRFVSTQIGKLDRAGSIRIPQPLDLVVEISPLTLQRF